MAKVIEIHSEYITVGQFLKLADIVSSGGMAKWYLQENTVFVNGEAENRRGRKLYDGDMIRVPEFGPFIIKRVQ